MDLWKMDDAQFSRLAQDVSEEQRRRLPDNTDANEVRGQEMAKRALLVAVAGGHSLLFVGPSGTGKTLLRRLAHELGLDATYEAKTCPCGNWNDPRRSCSCTSNAIVKHQRKWPVADLFIECPPVPEREMRSSHGWTTTADLRRQLEGRIHGRDVSLDDDSLMLLRNCVSELGMDARQRELSIRVARTIADLDGCEKIEVRHLMEAVNYRMPTR